MKKYLYACIFALGLSPHALAGEIEKLALYCLDRQAIDEADVEQALSSGHRNTIFTLVDSIGAGRLAQSLACGGEYGVGHGRRDRRHAHLANPGRRFI